jgi:hypothetical protein
MSARLLVLRPVGRPNVSDPRTGGCLCGAIRYETVGEPVFTLRCHCRDCQRQSGAAHVPAARVPSAGFRILQGIPKRYVTKADSGNDIVRVFCGNCGTPLYVQVGTRPDLIGLRVCTLDDVGWFQPDADIFMKSAQPWDHDQPNVPKYDGYPLDNPTRPRRPAKDCHRSLRCPARADKRDATDIAAGTLASWADRVGWKADEEIRDSGLA